MGELSGTLNHQREYYAWVPQTGLSPAPKNLYFQKSPLENDFFNANFSFILFFFVQIFVLCCLVLSMVIWMVTWAYGPLLVILGQFVQPLSCYFSSFCETKTCSHRKVRAKYAGSNAHYITPGTLIQSPTATVLQHHLIHNTAHWNAKCQTTMVIFSME